MWYYKAEMRIKRVLIYSTAYYPFVGGAEVSVKEITDRLGSDFEFDMITARIDKKLVASEMVGRVTVHRVGFGFKTIDKLLLPFLGALKTLSLEKQNEYFCFWGVMVTYASGAGFIANIIRSLSGKKKVPMILGLQEGDSETYLKYKWGGLINLSWKLALARTDVLIALSSFLLSRARRFGYEGPNFVVPNGVDVSLFSSSPSASEVDHLKNKLGKKDGDIYLITTSRLNHKNAVDDCIRALKYLPTSVTLLIIGVGEQEEKLRTLAREIGMRERVKFLGFIPHAELPKFLKVSDIFVRPSRSEGFGNSFIEAMAAGIPVVATPVGGIPDFLDDHETGVFCRPDNPKSVAEAVMEIMDNPNLREKIIRQGKERAMSRYSWDVVVKDMKEKVFTPLI